MKRTLSYTVVIEKGATNYSAFVPDLPGCIAVGDTIEEVTALIREAITFHIEGLRDDGEPIPPPATIGRVVEVDVAA